MTQKRDNGIDVFINYLKVVFFGIFGGVFAGSFHGITWALLGGLWGGQFQVCLLIWLNWGGKWTLSPPKLVSIQYVQDQDTTAKDTLTLDVGCGFLKEHTKRGMIGLDRQRGLCNVVGDAEHLPFQDSTFNEILVFDVLEHLPQPLSCLEEISRVAKDNATFHMKIPCEPKMFSADMFMLKKLLCEFPFSLPGLLRYYRIRSRHKKLPGYLHINEISMDHIQKYCQVERVEKRLMWKLRLGLFRGKYGLSSWLITAKKRGD